MSTAEIKQTKSNLIAWIDQLSDINMLSFLESIKNSRSGGDWWDDLSEGQKERINKGLHDIEAGRLMPAEDFWTKLKNA